MQTLEQMSVHLREPDSALMKAMRWDWLMGNLWAHRRAPDSAHSRASSLALPMDCYFSSVLDHRSVLVSV